MSKIQSIPIDQHYVPRSYLRNFAKIAGVGKKEKITTCFYQFSNHLFKENIPTKSICYKHYFYGEDGLLEKALAEREGKWASVLQRISCMTTYELNEDDETNIKEFAVFQFSRTLASLNFTKDTTKEILSEFIREQLRVEVDAEVEKIIMEQVNSCVAPSILIDVCNRLLSLLSDLKISVMRFQTKNKLITSDAPVIVMNPFCASGGGFANIGIFILFPVSCDTLVAIYDGKLYGKCQPFMQQTEEQDVINLNKYQIISAEQRIIAIEKEDLEKALQNTDAFTARDKYLSARKITVAKDTSGTMFGARSRSIPYQFLLSFCSLPRHLQKIHSDYRDAYQREYTREAWIKALATVYRLPDLLKKDYSFSDEEISKRKIGYSKMRTFLENYWELPMEKRAISPELMYKLQQMPIQKFKA